MRRIGFALAFAVIGVWPAGARAATCLTGGTINICENPLDGSSSEATVVGGTFVSTGGFRIDQKGDRITFDLGTSVTSGTVRFSITNVSLTNLNQDTHLLLLITDTPTLNPAPKYELELKIWGTKVDPTAGGTTTIGVGDGVQESSDHVGKLTWTASTTYNFDVSWDDAAQTVKLVRNGVTLANYKTGDHIPGPDNPPIPMRYRYVHLALPYMSNPAFWPVIKSVYKMASISADSSAPSGGGTGGTSSGGSGGTSASGGTSGSGGLPDSGGTGGSSGGAAGAPELSSGGGTTNSLGGQSFGGASAGGMWGSGGSAANPQPIPSGSVEADGGTSEQAGGCNASARATPPSTALIWISISFGLAGLRRRSRDGGAS